MSTKIQSGYLPEKDDFGLPLLSKDICISLEGFVEKFPAATNYLGVEQLARHLRVYISTTIAIAKHVDISAFGKWWNKSINEGSNHFRVELPMFGPKQIVRVRFISDLNIVMQHGMMTSAVQLELHVDESLGIVPSPLGSSGKVAYVLSCANTIDCDTILECI